MLHQIKEYMGFFGKPAGVCIYKFILNIVMLKCNKCDLRLVQKEVHTISYYVRKSIFPIFIFRRKKEITLERNKVWEVLHVGYGQLEKLADVKYPRSFLSFDLKHLVDMNLCLT